jgi:hypothetical protein
MVSWSEFGQLLLMLTIVLFVVGLFITIIHLDLLRNRAKVDIERKVAEKKHRLENL